MPARVAAQRWAPAVNLDTLSTSDLWTRPWGWVTAELPSVAERCLVLTGVTQQVNESNAWHHFQPKLSQETQRRWRKLCTGRYRSKKAKVWSMLQAGHFMQVFCIKSCHNSTTTTTTTTPDWHDIISWDWVIYCQKCNCCILFPIQFTGNSNVYWDDWKITKKRKTEHICQHLVGHRNIKGSINKTEIIPTYLSWLQAMGFLSQHISPSYTTFRLFVSHTHTHTHWAQNGGGLKYFGESVMVTREGET